MSGKLGQSEKKRLRAFIAALLGTMLALLCTVVSFAISLRQDLERSAILWLSEVTASYGSMIRAELLKEQGPNEMGSGLAQYRCTVMGQFGVLLVTDREGNRLAASYGVSDLVPDQNLFDYLGKAQLPRGYDPQTIREHMTVLVSDGLVLRQGTQKLFLSYAPTGYEDRYLFCIVPYGIIAQELSDMSGSAYTAALLVLVLLLLVMGYVLYTGAAQRQINLDQQKQMRASEARYKLIAQKSKDIIFEYDLLGGYMVHSENADILTTSELHSANIAHCVVEKGLVHPEDAGLFHDAVRQVLTPQQYAEAVLRIRITGEDYLWYQLTMACVEDNKGRPWRVVGRAQDVDRQKREEELLMERASRDPLTKLLNKMATRKAIDALLEAEPRQLHAYLIIDIDYFKSINDSYGHAMGDLVLAQIGERLAKLFRSSDILGRIGGDELVVFCRDIKTQEMAEQRAQQIGELFHTLGQELENGPQSLTCSIGIAMAFQDGNCFNQLYVNADLALYTAKAQGRDRHVCYEPALRKTANAQMHAAVNALL